MGQSLRAEVFWGYDFGESLFGWAVDPPAWYQNEEGHEEVYAKLKGWIEVPFPDNAPPHSPPAGMGWREWERERARLEHAWRQTAEYQAWSASLDAKRDLVEACPVGLGSYGVPAYWSHQFIGVKASMRRVSDACEELPDLASFGRTPSVMASWAEQLKEYLAMLEIPAPDRAPAWHLALSYG